MDDKGYDNIWDPYVSDSTTPQTDGPQISSSSCQFNCYLISMKRILHATSVLKQDGS